MYYTFGISISGYLWQYCNYIFGNIFMVGLARRTLGWVNDTLLFLTRYSCGNSFRVLTRIPVFCFYFASRYKWSQKPYYYCIVFDVVLRETVHMIPKVYINILNAVRLE